MTLRTASALAEERPHALAETYDRREPPALTTSEPHTLILEIRLVCPTDPNSGTQT